MRRLSLVKRIMPQNTDRWRGTTVLAGIVTAGTQIVLLREVLSAFLGNELVIGVLLFDWLILTGMGALFARRWTGRLSSRVILPIALGFLLILPPLTFIGFRFLPLVAAPPGSMLDIWVFLAGAIVVMSPACLASGAIFSMLVRAAVSSGVNNPAGKVYAWEAIGSLTGGALFGVLLFDLIASQDLLLLLCACAGVAGAAISWQSGERSVAAVILSGVLLLVIGRTVYGADRLTLPLRYPGHAILEHHETPFGVLTVTRLGEQTTVFANNIPMLVSGTIANAEETVHLAVVQRPHAPAVLLAGGNPAEIVPEVLKYHGSAVYLLEENSWLRKIEQAYLPYPQGERVTSFEGDLRTHLRNMANTYDVIILVSPEPSTLQANRFYTREAAELAHRALRSGGVLCLSLPSSTEYAGDDARRVRAILRNTLAGIFERVLILPVGHDQFLASDSTLRPDIAAAVAEAGVTTSYVNADYIQDDLLAGRSRRLDASLARDVPVNRDAHPVLMLAQIRYWLQYFAADRWVLMLFCIILVLLLVVRTDRLGVGVMMAGCGGIVLELMILMIVQVSFGNVYKTSGALIALYMAGLGLGAFAGGTMKLTPTRYAGMQGSLAVALLVAAWVQPGVSSGSTASAAAMIIALVLGSFGAGAVFTLSSRKLAQEPVVGGSRLYGWDLLGSAIGALLVGPLLLPLLGVQSVANAAICVVVVGTVISLSSPVWRVHEQA
jgi:spermidine synthase